MPADPKNPTPGDTDRAKMMRVLIPAGAVALIVILAAVLVAVFEGNTPTTTDKGGAKGGPSTDPPRPRRSPAPTDLTRLSDGTSPTADDPDLKPIGSSGLLYRDLKEGDGPEAKTNAHVVMDYTGWLKSNGHMFDSSWKPGGRPLDMPLGKLIKGWQQGVPGMKVGGIRKLVIPPALGYPDGNGDGIPPGATLVFEIELLGVR